MNVSMSKMHNYSLSYELTASQVPDASYVPDSSLFLTKQSIYLGIVALCIVWFSSSAPILKAPTAGYRSIFEPNFLLRVRYLTNAAEILIDGYKKFKNSLYIVRRLDQDITILSPKYLDELRSITMDELSFTHANLHNMTGKYTNLNRLLDNDQFIRVIQDHLNPNISKFMTEVQAEMDFAFKTDIPDCKHWQQVEIHTILLDMVSRITARILMGHPYCRNEKWLEISKDHTVSIFSTAYYLRMVPPFLHPIASLLLPSRWRIWRNLREGREIIYPIIDRHARGEQLERDPALPATLLQWMVENATPEESNREDLVLRQMFLAIAAIFTSSQTASHLMFDLAANPDYLEAILEEIKEEVADPSYIDSSKLTKLDMCLTETLRLNPVLLDAPTRLARTDFKLKDGNIIPSGSLIGFPCHAIALDESIYHEAATWKPFRKENKLSSSVMPNRNKLVFGWGKQACPGRFFAVKEIKMLVARLVLEYEFKIIPGTEDRPRFFDIGNSRVFDPQAKLLMRRRQQEAC